MKITTAYLYIKYLNFFNFSKKLNRLIRTKKLYKKILRKKIKRYNRLRNLRFQNAPKSRQYWKQPGLRKKMKFYKRMTYYLRDRRHPWLFELAKKNGIYKWNFYKSAFRKKYTNLLKKNKTYTKYFFDLAQPKSSAVLKKTINKKQIQKRPFCRYYIYLPYFNHISPKKFIKKNKKLRKTKKKTILENKWLKTFFWNTDKFLTRINFAATKQNVSFLLNAKAVTIHNKQNIIGIDLKMNKKKIIVPICKRIKEKTLDWKKNSIFDSEITCFKEKKHFK